MAEREWLPDPTGRHPFRSQADGKWGDLVAMNAVGEGVETDIDGGRAARGEEPQAPSKSPDGCVWAAIGAIFLVAAIVIIASFAGGDDDGPSGTSSFSQTSEYEVENPASIRVFVEVTNTGTEGGTATCRVEASDDSGAYTGYGTFDMEEYLEPGDTGGFNGTVVITDQGALFVTDVQVECE